MVPLSTSREKLVVKDRILEKYMTVQSMAETTSVLRTSKLLHAKLLKRTEVRANAMIEMISWALLSSMMMSFLASLNA